jgi:hypothetical protein
LEPDAKFRDLNKEFMRLYRGAANHHRVLLNELDQLPTRRRKIIVDIQRQIISLVEEIISDIRTEPLPATLRRPITMLFFGMINWTHTWLDPTGPVSSQRVAELASDIFLGGLKNATGR